MGMEMAGNLDTMALLEEHATALESSSCELLTELQGKWKSIICKADVAIRNVTRDMGAFPCGIRLRHQNSQLSLTPIDQLPLVGLLEL